MHYCFYSTINLDPWCLALNLVHWSSLILETSRPFSIMPCYWCLPCCRIHIQAFPPTCQVFVHWYILSNIWLTCQVSCLVIGRLGRIMGRSVDEQVLRLSNLCQYIKENFCINFQRGYYHNKHSDELLLKPFWEVGHVTHQSAEISSNSGNPTQQGTINYTVKILHSFVIISVGTVMRRTYMGWIHSSSISRFINHDKNRESYLLRIVMVVDALVI